jgi:bifunctional DNA-binding transcriptional regulator/antitoxin component of YhaV-PrlF toxin-antitoxin module
VPAEVRRKLGLAPGSVIEWDDQGTGAQGAAVIVRKAGRYTSAEVHAALFPSASPPRRSLDELKAGIADHLRRKHARR